MLWKQAIIHLSFLNNLINFAIVLAGLIIGGFGGLSASELPSPMNVIAPVALLEFGALIFVVLAMIFAYEEIIINALNKQILPQARVFLYSGLWSVALHPKLLFIVVFAILSLIFAWIYRAFKGLHFIPGDDLLLALFILCVIFSCFTVILKCKLFRKEKIMRNSQENKEV